MNSKEEFILLLSIALLVFIVLIQFHKDDEYIYDNLLKSHMNHGDDFIKSLTSPYLTDKSYIRFISKKIYAYIKTKDFKSVDRLMLYNIKFELDENKMKKYLKYKEGKKFKLI